jgi:hypothetical protein
MPHSSDSEDALIVNDTKKALIVSSTIDLRAGHGGRCDRRAVNAPA